MVDLMGKAMGNISQKPITVKLNREQIAVLDRVAELGEFNGRSHAIRELLLPALDAGAEAMKTGKGYSGLLTYAVLMKKLVHHFDKIAENSKDLRLPDGQTQFDIKGLPKELGIDPLLA